MKSKILLTLLLLLICVNISIAQDQPTTDGNHSHKYISGKVINAKNDSILPNVNIVNLNQVKGTTSNNQGNFKIPAVVNDSIFLSYIGFETITVRVTDDWIKYGNITIAMTESGIALQEVEIKTIALTGFLEIDARRAPIYNNRRYSINGLSRGYEAGKDEPAAITKVLGSIFNPADFLYNLFGKNGKSMRKLRQIKEEDEIRNLLQSKYDRETLENLLQMDKVNIDNILRNCQYSKSFIDNSNDLQILDAISECYEEYKLLNRN